MLLVKEDREVVGPSACSSEDVKGFFFFVARVMMRMELV